MSTALVFIIFGGVIFCSVCGVSVCYCAWIWHQRQHRQLWQRNNPRSTAIVPRYHYEDGRLSFGVSATSSAHKQQQQMVLVWPKDFPANVKPGQKIQMQSPCGQTIQVQIPPNMKAGMKMVVNYNRKIEVKEEEETSWDI